MGSPAPLAQTWSSEPLRDFLDDVAAGDATVPIGKVLDLEEIQQAHRIMEAGTAGGKIVVVTASARTSSSS